jgi:hypothetical protein
MSTLLALLAAVASLSATGCGGSPGAKTKPPATASPITSSGITGLVTGEGGPPPGDPRPAPGAKIEVHRGGETGPIVETVKSGTDGTFKVGLPPGNYTVVPVATGDELIVAASVTVDPGQWAQVNVGFSVK